MTGMPSFGAIEVPDQEIWSIVAFVKKLPSVTDAASGAMLTRAKPPRTPWRGSGSRYIRQRQTVQRRPKLD